MNFLFALPNPTSAVDTYVQGWEQFGDVPTPFHRAKGAVFDGVYYLIGGAEGTGFECDGVEGMITGPNRNRQ